MKDTFLNFFKRPPSKGGGKDHPMPQGTPPGDSPTAAAPPASPATVDPTGALTDAVRQLAQSQKALLEALRPPPAQPPGASGAAPGTGDDIRRIVSDVLRERDSSAQRTAARDRYVRERMSDLPDAYRRLMPEADDAADLAAAEADVRRRFRDDFRAAASATGAPAADVSGDAPGGRRPAAAVDYSRLSPLQQITVGLRDARPAQDAPRGGAPTPARRQSEGLEDGEDAGAASGAATEEFFGAD